MQHHTGFAAFGEGKRMTSTALVQGKDRLLCSSRQNDMQCNSVVNGHLQKIRGKIDMQEARSNCGPILEADASLSEKS
jgi:hypothetical protein